jgi:hypothetical protein
MRLEIDLANDLRVLKREFAAEVTFLFAANRPQPCLFFLGLYSPQRYGEESLAEYLNSLDAFFPLRDKATREFFTVHVNQIICVREASVAPLTAGMPLHLFLQNGGVLDANTGGPRHAWRSRPLDLLNDGERFISLNHDERTRIHVNKRHIVRVEGI